MQNETEVTATIRAKAVIQDSTRAAQAREELIAVLLQEREDIDQALAEMGHEPGKRRPAVKRKGRPPGARNRQKPAAGTNGTIDAGFAEVGN